MTQTEVTLVRIYCTESDRQVEKLLALLHDEAKVAGVTTFRGISGFGRSGHWHSSSLLDLSLDLPVIIEFFDRPDKVAAVMPQLNTMVAPGHMVSWSAHANLED
jgi:PII-like signaling protein